MIDSTTLTSYDGLIYDVVINGAGARVIRRNTAPAPCDIIELPQVTFPTPVDVTIDQATASDVPGACLVVKVEAIDGTVWASEQPQVYDPFGEWTQLVTLAS